MKSGLNIKLKRIEKGYKQYELAEKLGITRQYLLSIENGNAKNPNIELIKKISKLLNTSAQELFFY